MSSYQWSVGGLLFALTELLPGLVCSSVSFQHPVCSSTAVLLSYSALSTVCSECVGSLPNYFDSSNKFFHFGAILCMPL